MGGLLANRVRFPDPARSKRKKEVGTLVVSRRRGEKRNWQRVNFELGNLEKGGKKNILTHI